MGSARRLRVPGSRDDALGRLGGDVLAVSVSTDEVVSSIDAPDGVWEIAATPPLIVPRHRLSAVDVGRLEDRLYAYNRLATGRDDGLPMAFVALDGRGVQIGAVAGYSWAGFAEIKQLWVEEGHRGHGLGGRMVECAVDEAAARDCQAVWVLSYSFQAPGFYERHGFERIAELTDWPPGHAHVVLRRRIG